MASASDASVTAASDVGLASVQKAAAGSSGTDEVVTSERRDGGIGLIRLDRPARRNALNGEVKDRITEALRGFAADPAVLVVIVTGSDSVFVAGTDIAEMAAMTPVSHADGGTNAMFKALRDIPKPTIAAVEGYALGGGCELALNCDMIVASRAATFGQPEIRVGIMPGAGGTQILLRTLGRHRAMKLLLTGEPFGAEDAFAMGLVSELVEAGEALESALALARTICTMPPLSVRAIKQSVQHGLDAPFSVGLAYERRCFEALFATADQKEGMQAFLEKRRPAFQGR